MDKILIEGNYREDNAIQNVEDQQIENEYY